MNWHSFGGMVECCCCLSYYAAVEVKVLVLEKRPFSPPLELWRPLTCYQALEGEDQVCTFLGRAAVPHYRVQILSDRDCP